MNFNIGNCVYDDQKQEAKDLRILELKYLNHVKNQDKEEIQHDLEFCMQVWPDYETCPIDNKVILFLVKALASNEC